MRKILAMLVLALAVTGCPKKPKEEKKATKAGATIEAKSGSRVAGTVTFEPVGESRLKVTVSLTGLTPGDHGIHLHQKGDCSAPDASSAGDHWNPTDSTHGGPGAAQHHLGDLGNINAKPDGTANLTLTIAGVDLQGKKGVIGQAFIVHEKADDLTTQPSGAAGGRIGCGVVTAME